MFNFNFGKKKPDIKQYAIITIVVSSVIAALSQCSGISENKIWDLLDETQRRYFPQTIINDLIIKDPEKLDRRVKRDVDKSIRDVTPEYDRIISDYNQKYKPRYHDLLNDDSVCYSDECKKLGGGMRLCAPWVLDCPPESVVK